MNLSDFLSLVVGLSAALVSASLLLYRGWKRKDWLYVLISLNLAWIAGIYSLVLTGIMPQVSYPAWARPSGAFVFFSFALLIWGKRL